MLYVKGLLPEVTEDQLKEKFEPYGKLDRVRKVKDYAFVHFSEREHCMTVSSGSIYRYLISVLLWIAVVFFIKSILTLVM